MKAFSKQRYEQQPLLKLHNALSSYRRKWQAKSTRSEQTPDWGWQDGTRA